MPEAIRKATEQAKRGMIRVPLREGRTLHHDVKGRFGAGKVMLRAAPAGTGIIAGGPMRAVFETLGIQDIVAKSVGTSNPHNMIKATFAALRAAQLAARGRDPPRQEGRRPARPSRRRPAARSGGEEHDHGRRQEDRQGHPDRQPDRPHGRTSATR